MKRTPAPIAERRFERDLARGDAFREVIPHVLTEVDRILGGSGYPTQWRLLVEPLVASLQEHLGRPLRT